MECRSVLTRIDALRTGELESKDEKKVEQHLKTCRSCDDSATDVEEFASAVKSLVTKSPRSCLKKLHEELADGFDLITRGDDRAWVAFSDRGIRMIDLRARSAEEFERKFQRRFGRGLRQAALPAKLREQVVAGLEGRGPRNPSVDLSGVTKFEREVLRTIQRIPRGQVRAYSWVARQVHRPKAARAVGLVMARNPIPVLLPCHRVVPASGGIGNYAFGVATKRTFLTREGCVMREIEKRRA
jgi:methylated-DNA-[protein]-cysteine S-methyltransferase